MIKYLFKRGLAAPLFVLFLIATAVFALLYLGATAEGRRLLEMEAAKSMLQVVAVAIIGGLATMLVREYEDRRRAWVTRRDLLRTDLSEKLGEVYARTKQIRRQLRAATDSNNLMLEYSKYVELLEDLSDIQLTLERLERAAEAGACQEIISQSVAENLHSMEQYLGQLVTEYDTSTQQQHQAVALTNKPKLRGFTAKSSESMSTFKTAFAHPFHKAASAVEQVVQADIRRT